MPTYTLRRVEIDFPYEAYDLQLAYMERVIQALQERKHALLESPTGTGKTLCLLCATLAWRQAEKRKEGREGEGATTLPPIVYASRTHSQLCQAMKEIKKTSYRVKASLLGSRQQQCCNPDLQDIQGTARNHACVKLARQKQCQWFRALDEMAAGEVNHHASEILDLEDLNKLAMRPPGPCPFYLTRKMAEQSDIVFLPYNYLVDKVLRKGVTSLFAWMGAIVIFDEAHNIEQSCSEAASFDLPVDVLSDVIAELEKMTRICTNKEQAELDLEEGKKPRKTRPLDGPSRTKSWSALSQRCFTLINMVKSLEGELRKKKLPKDGKTFPGVDIFNILGDACITDQNYTILKDALEDAAEQLAEVPSRVNDNHTLKTRLNGGACSLFADALEKAFASKDKPPSGGPPYHKAFRVHIHREKQRSDESRLVLSYWCFSPGIAMKQLVTELNLRNVVITSGTLSPLDSFASELTLPFPIRLENEHIIKQDQALVRCVSFGPTGVPLDSSYKCRDSPQYLSDLGNTVVSFIKAIPGGVLMFFPSYIVLQNCVESWKSKKQGKSVWERIQEVKHAIVEPKNPAQFPTKIRDYRRHVSAKNGKGSIFFAVCRGKVSEGIDFSDNAGRAVILAGIPYAQCADPKVKLKREFLNQSASGINGTQWYCQTAVRAINQAMGRVIRHKDDYGAILLCDRRFEEGQVKNQLSKWVRGFLGRENSFGTLLGAMTNFFKEQSSRGCRATVRSGLAQVKTEVQEVEREAPSVKEEAGEGDLIQVKTEVQEVKREAPPIKEEANGTVKQESREREEAPSAAEEQHASVASKRSVSVKSDDEVGASAKRQKRKAEPAQPPCDVTRTVEQELQTEKEPLRVIDAAKEAAFSSNPNEFFRQMKAQLNTETYSQLRALLASFKENRDVASFQDALISILRNDDKGWRVLQHFVQIFQGPDRAVFLNKIQLTEKP